MRGNWRERDKEGRVNRSCHLFLRYLLYGSIRALSQRCNSIIKRMTILVGSSSRRLLARVIVAFAAIAISFKQAIHAKELFRDGFDSSSLTGWEVKEGEWKAVDGALVAGGRFSAILRENEAFRDGSIEADVAYESDKPHAASGLLFRMADDFTGYAVCLREVEKGEHPKFGAWERPVIQLFRKDAGTWALLQESKVMGCRSGFARHLKVVCRGADVFVFYEDMETPVLKEFDDRYNRAGRAGFYKDVAGTGRFDNFVISTIDEVPTPSLRIDWSWVRGAVYVRSDAVNSVEMWHDYWKHTAVLDREFAVASMYGFNMI